VATAHGLEYATQVNSELNNLTFAHVKRLYCAADLIEAHLLRHLLGEVGIEVKVLNENAQSGMGEIPFTHAYPEIWLLNDRDEPRARRVLEDHEHSRATNDVRPCLACGESNPANFALCWQCGAALA
jgi:hypothetical protein